MTLKRNSQMNHISNTNKKPDYYVGLSFAEEEGFEPPEV